VSEEISLHLLPVIELTDSTDQGTVMGRVERDREIARRRTRRAKLKKLRARYEAASSQDEKEAIAARARKLSPFISFEEHQEA